MYSEASFHLFPVFVMFSCLSNEREQDHGTIQTTQNEIMEQFKQHKVFVSLDKCRRLALLALFPSERLNAQS
jgi:hypothetical protein